ncbi:small ribosomal subunit protein mS26 [Pantherophis guttatus]|uniref:Small ribosomal subunit protein mS26 n=1 Tax=Pantherophis guttatus TaxID=94885 RepID=A0A6P9AXF2_PANGU|nr:small ribosomal subunit protein mS26 [Pantherophis guttatus]
MLAAGLRGLPGRAALLGRGVPSLVPSRGRKTRFDPPAKSKADRIKVPPPVDPAELLVILDRYEQYRRVVSALRFEMKEEVQFKSYDLKYGETAKLRKKAEDDEHQRLMALNDAENKRLLERRLERLRKAELLEKSRKLESDQHREVFQEEFLKKKEEEVLQLQEESQNFITLENLDQRIEECLNKTQNYNFAIDKDGRIVKRTAVS